MRNHTNVIATTIFFLILFGCNLVNAQTFSNVRVRQEDFHIYITYDMKGQLPSNSEVLFGYSIDDGKNFTIINGAAGDVGKKVTPGTDKVIRWPVFNTTVSGKNTKFTVGAMNDFIPDGFVFVPGGSFTMGDVWGDGRSNEKPTHRENIDAFYMTKYEIKQKLYEDVMGRNPSEIVNENNPVENVSWEQAIEFCNKLSLFNGLNPCYTITGDNVLCDWSANGYRLPTEAEWEYSARGGGRNDQKWSGTGIASQLSEYAWYSQNSERTTHPVGTKRPNDLGLFDMGGNVWEWCWDQKNIIIKDRLRGNSTKYHVIRGNGYSTFKKIPDEDLLRTSFRTSNYDSGSGIIGFRIVGQKIYEYKVKKNNSEKQGLSTNSNNEKPTLSKSYFPFRNYFNNKKKYFMEKSWLFQGGGVIREVNNYLFPAETFYGITLSTGDSDLLNQLYIVDETDTTDYGVPARTVGVDLDFIRFALGKGGAGNWSQDLILSENGDMVPYRWEIPFFLRTSIGLPIYYNFREDISYRLFLGLGINEFSSELVAKDKTILDSKWNNTSFYQSELTVFMKEFWTGLSLGYITTNFSSGEKYSELYLRIQLALFN